MSDRLYRMCRKRGIRPTAAVEVGVYYPETSNLLGFIEEGVPTQLVEADPLCVARIEDFFRGKPWVRVVPVAVWEHSGRVTLYRTRASTFVEAVEGAPAQVNDAYVPNRADRFEAPAVQFSEIDDGVIDLLSVDIEGAEWAVLKYMRSRPRVITLETHAGEYTNPHLHEIEVWMAEHGYRRWFIDNTDTVYIRQDIADFKLLERAYLGMTSQFTLLRHRLKRIKRQLRRRLSAR